MSKNRDFLTGALLIAMPGLRDPRFERSVVYLCAHDAEHAYGLIVNKPLADVTMAEVLERMEIAADDISAAGAVYFGGPVGMERGAVLHTRDYEAGGTTDVANQLGLTWTRDIIVDIVSSRRRRPPPRRHLFAVGYAGWSDGQLESEIASNSWAHCAYDPDLVFSREPALIWERALAKLGVSARHLSGDWFAERAPGERLN